MKTIKSPIVFSYNRVTTAVSCNLFFLVSQVKTRHEPTQQSLSMRGKAALLRQPQPRIDKELQVA
jgi:hypothetical protein